ncbi:MAG: hypothetical protein CMQ88_00395 [Gammaproteobacteria bacterium]|jgi:hypothetical protein|nr:hypothetical protein [Gammaproteobacteria bacterium]|tara:strand:+ start:9895 stop:10419 length:525 start_codon:yes stop_codon:yes gene_type:complete
MDISEFDIGQPTDEFGLKEGRYNMTYYESMEIENNDGWKGIRITFKVLPSNQFASATFTVQHKNPKAVEMGTNSLRSLFFAAGLDSVKNTEELDGLVISAPVKHNTNGYPEVSVNIYNSDETWGQEDSNLPKFANGQSEAELPLAADEPAETKEEEKETKKDPSGDIQDDEIPF